MSWTYHFDSIITKGQSLIYLIRCIITSNDLLRPDLDFLVNSLLVPVLCYASPCWSNSTKWDQARLASLHKSAYRIMQGISPSRSLYEIIQDINWNFFRDCLNADHPLHSLIPSRTERASRNRGSIIPVPRANTERLRRHFLIASIKSHNARFSC